MSLSPPSSPVLVPSSGPGAATTPINLQSEFCLDGSTCAAVKHERFYYEDGTVNFLVEGFLYQLHRYLFRGSSILASDEKVVKLVGVRSSEFDAFLSVMYPTRYDRNDPSTVEEWTAVLRLASEWQFSSIRELAIQQLTPIASAVDNIVLGHEYGLDDWLIRGYVDLCLKPSPPLAIEEAQRLSTQDIIMVFNMRESTVKSTTLFTKEEITARLQEQLRPPPPPRRPTPPPRDPSPVRNSSSSLPQRMPLVGFLFSKDEAVIKEGGYRSTWQIQCRMPLGGNAGGCRSRADEAPSALSGFWNIRLAAS
ncbi:hypothetical protein FA95DRAFT_1573742 [Auriscalpium vulgare]|uniref:Uncharacterized protein n=1 Tax=Auriscalpium vulgare TaxID=40419 RepID=A0ACB8RMQ0_9AGAM|nr:hypothetical protein FA95DRAFT_1573742 [Auriscalpium vulgare]